MTKILEMTINTSWGDVIKKVKEGDGIKEGSNLYLVDSILNDEIWVVKEIPFAEDGEIGFERLGIQKKDGIENGKINLTSFTGSYGGAFVHYMNKNSASARKSEDGFNILYKLMETNKK